MEALHEPSQPAYGLWTLVILNSAVFVLFAFSFSKPCTARDWRSFGAFAAFIVALFVEMYGFPLSIYLLSGWLQSRYPGLDLLSHDSGHLWSTLTGSEGDPHASALHIASYVLLGVGFWLLSSAWSVLYHAQRRDVLAMAGPYGRMRHPQYVAFVLILLGFLLQWPTLLTLAMFPILLVMYARLALREEAELRERFGEQYEAWAARTPRFVPALYRPTPSGQKSRHALSMGWPTGRRAGPLEGKDRHEQDIDSSRPRRDCTRAGARARRLRVEPNFTATRDHAAHRNCADAIGPRLAGDLLHAGGDTSQGGSRAAQEDGQELPEPPERGTRQCEHGLALQCHRPRV